ncbi:MAG: hypothetical protein C0404_06845 [Verrucomicrobia bacterium]|nr:hypothetical protein [Verrucomicrobiota bacterium]
MIPETVGVLVRKYLDGGISAGELTILERWLTEGAGNMDVSIAQAEIHACLVGSYPSSSCRFNRFHCPS